jgi:alpha-glucosidase
MQNLELSSSLSNFSTPHHDGSELYVTPRSPRIGDSISLRVRVPKEYRFEKSFIRLYEDGEPRSHELVFLEEGTHESWWGVTVLLANKTLQYRFIFLAEDKYEWLSARGLFAHDVHSNTDFKIFAGTRAPEWVHSSVFYQIFPDRFAKSDVKRELPSWAKAREWNQLPVQDRSEISTEFYGGDLPGVEQHIEYIDDLGVNAIYFTPFFPARSNHRYDASSFTEVDPLLGGNEALQSLISAARGREIRILGDLTSNHCGAGHPWLATALSDKNSPERSFFYWDASVPHGYVGWWGVPSLPKLNFNSLKLRERMYAASDSIVKQWLSPANGLSGWRIDVGNMTGRQGADDLHDEVMHGIRNAMDEAGEEFWLLAENGDFIASDLDGSGWHGAMNYQGFMRPVWNWLQLNSEIGGGFQGLPFQMPKFTGSQLVMSMREFSASIPWDSFTSCMLLLDSHDTARLRTVVNGDRDRHLSGMALSLTFPGVPSIYAGDELGLEGSFGEGGRRTINWDNESSWDKNFLGNVKSLVHIRRTSHALVYGGLRWLEVEDDYLLFIRESHEQSLLVLISRSAVAVEINLASYGLSISRTLFGTEQSGNHLTIHSKTATQGIWEIVA